MEDGVPALHGHAAVDDWLAFRSGSFGLNFSTTTSHIVAAFSKLNHSSSIILLPCSPAAGNSDEEGEGVLVLALAVHQR